MALFVNGSNDAVLKILCFLTFFNVFQTIWSAAPCLRYEVHHMDPGTKKLCNCGGTPLEIYCYIGKPKHFLHALETIQMKITGNPSSYDMYLGFTPEEVAEQCEMEQSSWTISLLPSKSDVFELDPFNRTCIGVFNREQKQYAVELIRIRFDYWRLLMLIIGLSTFFSAPKLSGNALFYYICGITFGITASFLILTYFFSKLFPQRPLMYGFLVGGSTVGLYILQLIWGNMQLILQQYQKYVLLYIGCTGLLSFVICYRMGPVSDPRSKNLIKWALQGAGLIMIYFSTHYQEAAVALIMTVLLCYNFPSIWISKLQVAWKRRFPPKLKLLSEEEYYEQGVRETRKALDELRGYCSSPDCNAWRTVLRLKNPVRFAEFIQGDSHLNDDEILHYETESRRSTIGYDDYSDEEEED